MPFLHPSRGRHLRIARISTEIFMGLLRLDGTRQLRITGLPDDAQLVGIQHEILDDRLAILVESDSFGEVPEGTFIPDLVLQCELLESEDVLPNVTI